MEKEPVEKDQFTGTEVASDADVDDIQIEVRDCDDHQWETALLALDGFVRQGLGWVAADKGNTGPVGALLEKGLQPPPAVLIKLGRMLSSPKGYRGPRLVITVPKKETVRYLALEMSEKRDARMAFERLRESGRCYESAVKQVAEDFGMGRTWVTEAIKISDEKIVTEAMTWMGIR